MLLALAVLLAACGADGVDGGGTAEARPDPADWDAVVTAADGQTVDWWLFGGDARVNRYIDEHVVPAATDLGVELRRVPVDDTAAAVQRVLSEQEAGRVDGAVDLIWLNGENFALGKREGLWLESWATDLPRADLVDPGAVDSDFGVAVEGQESPWSRAAFVYAHDRARIPHPPRSFEALLDHAQANRGRITYPAPPDFTGSAFVRQVIAAMGEDDAFDYLARLDPLLWRGGGTYPGSEAELSILFGNGEVDLAMSYNPAFVATGVAQGTFPESARPHVLDSGTLANTSYITIPANAGDTAGALVVADLLLDPELQAIKADPDVLGLPTVLDRDRLSPVQRDRFDDTLEDPYVLADLGRLVDELPVDRVEQIERRWSEEIE